jgi:hypothetical protein
MNTLDKVLARLDKFDFDEDGNNRIKDTLSASLPFWKPWKNDKKCDISVHDNVISLDISIKSFGDFDLKQTELGKIASDMSHLLNVKVSFYSLAFSPTYVGLAFYANK